MNFQLNELLASHAALSFWKELNQRDFNAQNLYLHGYEISRYFGFVQNAAKLIIRLCPNDIKFHFRYGMFLITLLIMSSTALKV